MNDLHLKYSSLFVRTGLIEQQKEEPNLEKPHHLMRLFCNILLFYITNILHTHIIYIELSKLKNKLKII